MASDSKDQQALSMHSYDSKLERQAVRKLDYTILPVITMVYLLASLDRTNIGKLMPLGLCIMDLFASSQSGNARVAGLQKDLGLTDNQYQFCITILFAPYMASQLPSNLLLRRIGPALLMPSLLTIWGLMVTLQGLVTSFAGLVIIRVLLGLVEGPMAPGVLLYLSGFYTRRELSLRIAIYFSSNSLAGAFSGLLAAAIERMDGIGGRSGWSWIFILEGLFTVCTGIIAFYVLPSTPQDSRFLTHEQKDVIMARLERDRPSVRPVDTFSIREILQTLSTPHVIIVSMMNFMNGTMAYGLSYFLPSIVRQLGFSATKTQLLSVGPFAAGFFVTLISAYWSDHHNSRGVPMAIISGLAIVGYVLFLGATDKYVLYGVLYLIVPGVFAVLPLLFSWMANNSEPYYRRATSIASAFIMANCGGILSTWRYPTKEGPKFRNTMILNLTFTIVFMVGSLVGVFHLSRLNKQKQDPGYRTKVLDKLQDATGDDELKVWMKLGDRHPDFRYTL